MKEKNIFLTGIILVILALFSYRATYALFSDTATSTGNNFIIPESAAEATTVLSNTPSTSPTSSATPTPLSIVINEVFNGGAGNNELEWVELFNPTVSSIDVSGWKISDDVDDIFPTVSPIPANGYAVVITSDSPINVGSAVEIKLNTGTHTSIGNAGIAGGGDLILLRKADNSVVDAVSWGSDDSIFSSPPAIPSDRSLVRSPNGFDNDLGSDWILSTASSLGVSN